ncbi:S-adenosyl-L-methionine-dependent methyltransferase [Hypoxylon sp. FL1284]|nr:S-adenosyl-L-methionine-dependent methyltransferase [Hypoxylon sp. FL1284]
MSDPSAKATEPEAAASTSADTGAGEAAPKSPAPESSVPRSPVPETQVSATQATTDTTSADLPPTEPAETPNILPASYWAQATYDDESDDDSAYADDLASSTASVTSSILQYRTLHGRTFHGEIGNAESWNPNDAQHNESMEILHHASMLMQDDKLYLAPIGQNIQKVLDVGCGPGIWAIDFADEFPSAQVIGVDVSPTQPQWIPPNLRFELDDVTRPWTYKPETFDYIHMRWLVGHIEDWRALYDECFKALKPGGYFEHKDSSAIIISDDGTVAEDSALSQWGKVFNEGGRLSGKSFGVVEDDVQRKCMEAAGFVDIQEYDLKAPLGSWPADEKQRQAGHFLRLGLYQDIEGFLVMMWTSIMGWSIEEIQVYAAHLRRELRSKSMHPYYKMKVVIGRKPHVGEVP